MRKSLQIAQDLILSGADRKTVLRESLKAAAFIGSTRDDLIASLDAVQLPQRFGATSAGALFDVQSHLVDSTSALVFPTFRADGSDYNGSPRMEKQPLLRKYLWALADRLADAPYAFVVPLGPKVVMACEVLCDTGKLGRHRVLSDHLGVVPFAHPSGGNRESNRLLREEIGLADYLAERRSHITKERRDECKAAYSDVEMRGYLETRKSYHTTAQRTKAACRAIRA